MSHEFSRNRLETRQKDGPLRVRLIGALGLTLSDYAPEYLWPQHYHSMDRISEKRQEVDRFAWQAIENNQLNGRLALEFIDQQFSRRSMGDPGNLLYHGSPFTFKTLQPHQATWQDTRGRDYADGPPAICASDMYDFPTIRALFFDDRPELAQRPDIQLILAKHKDKYGRAHWITSFEAIEALQSVTGRVYAFFRDQQTAGGQLQDSVEAAPQFLEVRNEYRIYGAREPIARVTVGVSDLPETLILTANRNIEQLPSLKHYDNPRQFGDSLGIEITPLGGKWPITYFPS